jgi:hypothetical protein
MSSVVCAESPQRSDRWLRKRATIPSRNQSSSLSRVARSYRPSAEPKSKSPAVSRAPRDRNAARTRRDEQPLIHNQAPRLHEANCDSWHQSGVSEIRFPRAYLVVLQCVAVEHDLSSNGRETVAGEHQRCLHPRGPDNGKPVERPGRKAPRLKRKKLRHASRAAERFSRRST